jgi:hypothetical protein
VRARAVPLIVAALYLVAVGSAIAYELGIRVHDTAHAEFAGWLSAVLTLPTIILVNMLSASAFGMRMGDSNTSFVVIAGLAAAVNAAVIYALASFATAKRRPVIDR